MTFALPGDAPILPGVAASGSRAVMAVRGRVERGGAVPEHVAAGRVGEKRVGDERQALLDARRRVYPLRPAGRVSG